MKSTNMKQFFVMSLITLSILCLISIGFATRAAAGNYDVDSGKQASTYKNKDGQK